ncbi:VWA domain-containing protein [Acidipila sp. EB88]|uniref:VWA domain-containing protein n=1 Tax=Acidipila sp. EB88 TaxID=2305226 RepID=UPI000F5D7379|nr:VWA domain-containing protein [Acidipila sp. EB88]RRA48741.1 VWA domain-containing protein [Acidipila sp. EB88]
MRRDLLSLCCLLLSSPVLLAQAPAPKTPAPASSAPVETGPPTTLSVNARLVTLPVVVRDKKGKIVSGLTKEDFTLTEDSRPETIRYFSLDTNLPLTLALNVDTSGSMRDALDTERTASQSFLDDMITRPTDKAAVLHFDREVELLEDLTSSKPKLNEALNTMGPTPAENSDSGGSSGSSGGGNRRGGTQLYDAIYLSAHELLQKQTGRKAIIVLSDGEDRGSKETLHGAMEAAEKAEAGVYTIYFKGDDHNNSGGSGPGQGGGRRGGGIGFPGGGMGYPGGGGMGYPGGRGGGGQRPSGGGGEPHVDGKKIMQQIADETGGRFFEAKKKENFDEIYKQIAEELRQQYMLGYTPDAASEGDGFHRISLVTRKKDLFVQTRVGYYGSSSSSAGAKGN